MNIDLTVKKLKSHSNPIVLRNLSYKGADKNTIGVPLKILREISHGSKKNNSDAKKLFDTGIVDAMRLSFYYFNPLELSGKDFEELLSGTPIFLIADEVVSKLLTNAEIGLALKLSSKWKHSSFTINQSTGWLTLGRLIEKYPDLDFWTYNISNLLKLSSKKYKKQSDHVRYARVKFIEAAGIHLPMAREEALDSAQKIGFDQVSLSYASKKKLDPYSVILKNSTLSE